MPSKKKYKIEYLPAADRDLAGIIRYISLDLAAPQAAGALLKKIDSAVKSLAVFPYAHAIYQSAELPALSFEFRVLTVNSYLVFYYVREHTVTIARVIYGKRDIASALRR